MNSPDKLMVRTELAALRQSIRLATKPDERRALSVAYMLLLSEAHRSQLIADLPFGVGAATRGL